MKILTIAIFAMAYLFMPLILQAQNPTLTAGLETLTMTKGTIDVEALTQIIMEKQKELKQEALRRFILKLFPESNYTTKFYVQNCLNLLLNEKNPQVIEKGIYELTTNYALAMGVAQYFKVFKATDPITTSFNNASISASNLIEKFKNQSKFSAQNPVSATVQSISKKMETKMASIKAISARSIPATLSDDEKKKQKTRDSSELIQAYKDLQTLEAERNRTYKRQLNADLKSDEQPTTPETGNELPFGIWLDITSKALSETLELTKKGFFRKPIDFEKDDFYIRLSIGSANDKAFFNSMKAMSGTIRDIIIPYLDNYAVIETYYKTITDKNAQADIKNVVINSLKESFRTSVDENIANILNSEMKQKFPGVKLFFDNFNVENSKINALELLQQSLKVLPAADKDLKNLENTLLLKQAALADFKINIQSTFVADQVTKKLKPISPNDSLNLLSLNIDSLNQLFVSLNTTVDQASSALKIGKQQFSEIQNRAKQGLQLLGQQPPTDVSAWLSLNIDTAIYNRTINAAKGKIKVLFKDFTESEVFYKALLAQIASSLTEKGLLPDSLVLSEQNKEVFKDYAALISSTYKHVDKLIAAGRIEVEDIQLFEDRIIPEFVRLGTMLPLDNRVFNNQIKVFNSLAKLLKIQAVLKISDNFTYSEELKDVLKFVANLGKLDKAESYQDMLNLFDQTNNAVLDNLKDKEFKKTYTLFSNAIKKYTLVDTQKQAVEIDVASFLTDLQQYYAKNNQSRVGLYLTLGLNQNIFLRKIKLPGDTINSIGFASEKIGLKYRFSRLKNRNGLENTVKSDVNLNTNAPFVNELYGIVYGSGLLYSIANTSTTAKFDYPHVGMGLGIRFYNALDVNITAALPFIPRQAVFKNVFFGLGFDIPLGEYLEKSGNKKK